MNRSFLPAAALMAAALLPAPDACAGDWGGIYSAVMLTSDYRYQGVSSTDKGPAMQGYAYWWRPDSTYAFVFASQVDYGYDQSPSFEVDLAMGRNFDLGDGKTRLTAEAMASLFPDDETPGPTLNFVQFKVAARRTEGPLTLTGTASFVPDGAFRSGRIWRAEGEGQYQLAPKLKLKALAGRNWVERGQDRAYWSLGAETTWKTLTFEVRYQDTDLSRTRCGFNDDICGPSISGMVTVALPPVL